MGARVLILIIALAGCMKKSKLYCEMHPSDLENCGYQDAGIDARPLCTSDPDCAASPGAPYCETTTGFCVECYLPEHCAPNLTEKFCDLDMYLCTSCVSHQDCASEVCLPTGTCGDDNNVAYVDPLANAANDDCTLAAKCNTIAKALATMRPNIKLQGAISETVAIMGRSVTLLAAPGTTLTRAMAGVVVTVAGASDVAIYDLTVIGNEEKGIVADKSTLRLVRVAVTSCNRMDKRAVEAKDSTLIMSRCSIFANAGGGIFADAAATFNITNTFVYRNGSDSSMVGGVSLGAASSGLNAFELNTVVDNRATTTANAGGVSCASTLIAPNNIVARNYTGGLASNLNANKNTIGGCNFDQSIVLADAAPLAFAVPDGAGPWDYHIGPGSMAIDRGVTSTVTIDIDGDGRPFNMKFDVGADEYTP